MSADLGMNIKMATKPTHKWIVMHSSMAMKLPRVDVNGRPIVDRFGKEIYNVRSVEQGEPVVFTAELVDKLMEHGRGRKPRAKDFDDNKMPELSAVELADESVN